MNIKQGIIEILVGDDGKLSGKRVQGTFCTIVGLGIAIYSLTLPCDCLPNLVLLDGMVFTAGLAFWGITSIQSYFTAKNVDPENKPTE